MQLIVKLLQIACFLFYTSFETAIEALNLFLGNLPLLYLFLQLPVCFQKLLGSLVNKFFQMLRTFEFEHFRRNPDERKNSTDRYSCRNQFLPMR